MREEVAEPSCVDCLSVNLIGLGTSRRAISEWPARHDPLRLGGRHHAPEAGIRVLTTPDIPASIGKLRLSAVRGTIVAPVGHWVRSSALQRDVFVEKR